MSQSAMGYLRHIYNCNTWNPANFTPFCIAGEQVGRLKQPLVEALGQWPERFRISREQVELIDERDDFDYRTAQLGEVVDALVEQGVITHQHGERYPVTAAERQHAFATIDRTSAPYFGLRAYGQHLNGYVRDSEGLKMWIARRAADRRVFPDKLDNMVAGGLPHQLSLQENLQKECAEEASIPPQLASRAVPVSALSYCRETETGLKPDTIYCYDLELPADFVPENSDGEVAAFYLMPVEEVIGLVRETDEFKLNCNLVIIDFLIRHGIMHPEEPDYLEIIEGLHEKL
ncbi:NUDIX hydrolase [Candidatus Endoriftia persephone]|jgi:isopentenyldiphosphate isomerase|uniref:NUDIX hydrolase n=3 Tax=Gammaproteobacteria TaxID=1236 RepID=G2FIN6_9GAMM|nr:DUF4743 domain-containing protein [Candidatus Endoriftia persephone]EGV49914.1 NUDIX hydrolase [endosymbiont of Riftia pachyptila (vent Ph05)]EGW53348.1 NUDIX hydrolase [endosymbiont of Tevnia jerichonana (vent Tica)]USF86508.1 DUF4743 domain-containing protein [Candidatus Endoriftia persephone]